MPLRPPVEKIAAIIVAAGRGKRAGGGTPKQYRPLAGRAVLAWTLDAFASHPRISVVKVVIHPDDRDLYDEAVTPLAGDPKLQAPTNGGAERQDSVRLGLQSLEADGLDAVLVHDAARPFVTHDVIDRVIGAIGDYDGAVAALPVFDTVKRARSAGEPIIRDTLPRETIWRAQTPQGFLFDKIMKAHGETAGRALTDDAAVAEAADLDVTLVTGSPDNMKITQAEDFGMAETLIRRARGIGDMEYRTGQGFDVHAFQPGDHVKLCGVDIPHDKSLSGHSDADVAMHAVTDAILGAVGAGDIGAHFPPSDGQWKNAASRIFLEKARDLVSERNGKLVHIDVTIICENPKVGPHRAAMSAMLAEILHVESSRISVKATTTERLGFTGREEGIAAVAAATVAIPE